MTVAFGHTCPSDIISLEFEIVLSRGTVRAISYSILSGTRIGPVGAVEAVLRACVCVCGFAH